MLAAATAAQKGHDVTLIERNEKLGKKLFITGKGRCNLTNNAQTEDFFKNIPRNSKFLYSALYSFSNDDLIELFENQGVQMKVERGGRVFPASDKSSDILQALTRYMHQSGASSLLNTRVNAIRSENGHVVSVDIGSKSLKADAVVLATGGASYPRTGSTGDGYTFARALGHTVLDITPSLVPIETVQQWPRTLMGLSLRNVILRVFCEGKKKYEELGELLFTHFGVSGPLVLSASSHIDPTKQTELSIDLKPGLTAQQLDARLLRDFEKNSRKQFQNALDELLPMSMIPVMVSLSGIDPEKPVHQVTKEEREAFCMLLKDVRFDVSAFRPIDEAIITRGGVDIKEVNPSTMESKKVAGLYFAGEVLDVDAYTGGFNLQIAFSTGYLAGLSV